MSEAAKSLAPSGGSKLKSAADLFRATMIPPRPGPEVLVQEFTKEEPPKLEAVPAVSPKQQAVPTEAPLRTAATLPRATRMVKSDTSSRTDMSLKRATFFYRKQQILDLKRLRLRVLEMTEEEIDISDLVQEGVDLLLKKYNSTIRGDSQVIEGTVPQ
jgi:hypothetical protein